MIPVWVFLKKWAAIVGPWLLAHWRELAIAGLCFWLGFRCGRPSVVAPVAVLEKVAEDHKQAAEGTRKEAQGADEQAKKDKAATAKAETKARTAKAEVARLTAELDRVMAAPPSTEKDQKVIQEQAVVIGALRVEVKELEDVSEAKSRLISSLELSSLKWRETSESERKRSEALGMALLAQKVATKAAYWQGFRHGLGVGVGIGGPAGFYLGK